MVQLPELSDLNILTQSGILAEAVKLCSNTQMLRDTKCNIHSDSAFCDLFYNHCSVWIDKRMCQKKDMLS